MEKVAQGLVEIVEKTLTWWKIKRTKTLERRRRRHPILDWILSFLWAVIFVLFLNQYFVQCYQIPSGSMIPALTLRDRVLVDKFSFGVELLPGYKKIAGIKKPKRFDVVVFESPEYLSKGVLHEIAQRVLYMASLSLIDINRDKKGRPRVQFLIKRLMGMPRDTIRYRGGALQYRLSGTGDWIDESELRRVDRASFSHPPVSFFVDDIRARGKQYAHQWYFEGRAYFGSSYEVRMASSMYARRMMPSILAAPLLYGLYKNGWYVPDDHYFFMGDNRENSYDARFYGPVSRRKVLGHAKAIYYPFARMGGIP